MRRRDDKLYWLSRAGVMHLSVPGDEMARCGRPYTNMSRRTNDQLARRKCKRCYPSLFMDAG